MSPSLGMNFDEYLGVNQSLSKQKSSPKNKKNFKSHSNPKLRYARNTLPLDNNPKSNLLLTPVRSHKYEEKMRIELIDESIKSHINEVNIEQIKE